MEVSIEKPSSNWFENNHSRFPVSFYNIDSFNINFFKFFDFSKFKEQNKE